jgi:hypothetical protein
MASMIAELPYCSGSCQGGRAPCNCPTGQTELANSVGLRDEFPAPPDRTAEDDAFRAQFWQGLVLAVIGLAVMAAALAAWPRG